MKRILSLVMALCMIFTLCTSVSLTASAADKYYMDYDAWIADWDYEDGIIYGYYGKDKDVVVPTIAPDGTHITTLDKAVFKDNTTIENVVISEGIEMMGGECFMGCTNLKSVKMPSTLTSFTWGNNFVSCTSLKSLTIPGGISEIPVSFASGCTALKEVIFTPSGNDIVIRGGAFDGTGLTRIVLPRNVVEIHARAFFNTKPQGSKFELFIANPNVKLGGGKDNFGASFGANTNVIGIAPGFEASKAFVYLDSKGSKAIKFINDKVKNPPYVSATTKSTAYFDSLPEMKKEGIPETAADWDAIYKDYFSGSESAANNATGEVKEEVVYEGGESKLDTTTLIIILGAAFLFVILIIVVAIIFVVMKNKKAAKNAPQYPYPPYPPYAPAPQAPAAEPATEENKDTQE